MGPYTMSAPNQPQASPAAAPMAPPAPRGPQGPPMQQQQYQQPQQMQQQQMQPQYQQQQQRQPQQMQQQQMQPQYQQRPPMQQQQQQYQQQPMQGQYQQPMGQPMMQGQPMQGKPTPFSTDAKMGFGGAEIPALFSCMDDCEACAIGFAAPCVVSGKIAEATGDEFKKQAMIYSVLMYCCGSVADCYHGFMLSKKLHEQYPTPGEDISAIAYCFCNFCQCTGPCTKVQEFRYMKNLKAKGLLRAPGAAQPLTGPMRQAM